MKEGEREWPDVQLQITLTRNAMYPEPPYIYSGHDDFLRAPLNDRASALAFFIAPRRPGPGTFSLYKKLYRECFRGN